MSAGAQVLIPDDIVTMTLTPITIRMCHLLGLPEIPYLFSQFFAGNIWAVTLVTGNPTNVLLAEDLKDTFVSFAARMGIPGSACTRPEQPPEQPPEHTPKQPLLQKPEQPLLAATASLLACHTRLHTHTRAHHTRCPRSPAHLLAPCMCASCGRAGVVCPHVHHQPCRRQQRCGGE